MERDAVIISGCQSINISINNGDYVKVLSAADSAYDVNYGEKYRLYNVRLPDGTETTVYRYRFEYLDVEVPDIRFMSLINWINHNDSR